MGQEASPQSDIYSLACVLVEMLTGTSLFGGEGDSPPPLVMKRHFDPLELPDKWPEGVPDGINVVLERAFAKEPAERNASPGEFVDALQSLSQETEIDVPAKESAKVISEPEIPAASPSPEPERQEPANVPTLPWWQHKSLWALVGGATLVGLCIFMIALIANSQNKPETVIETVVIEVTSTIAEIALGATAAPTPIATTRPTETSLPTPTATTPPTETSLPRPTQDPSLGIGSTQIAPQDGMVMVYVPAGEFEMGSEVGNDNEKPVHTVYLDAFWIDQTEVTNAMFAAFLTDQGNQSDDGVSWWGSIYEVGLIEKSGSEWRSKSSYGNYPVTEVSWYGAQAYCEWIGRRLPTEAEWEKAARGSSIGSRDEHKYPWGEEINCNLANYLNCEYGAIAVGSYPEGASPYGVLDMAGNVSEWVADWYDEDYYYYSPMENPIGPESGITRVLRGGSHMSISVLVRSAIRGKRSPLYTDFFSGFRCARSP